MIQVSVSCYRDLIEDFQVKGLFTLQFSVLAWILIPAISTMENQITHYYDS